MVHPVPSDCTINYRTKAFTSPIHYQHLSSLIKNSLYHWNHSKGENLIKITLRGTWHRDFIQAHSLLNNIINSCSQVLILTGCFCSYKSMVSLLVWVLQLCWSPWWSTYHCHTDTSPNIHKASIRPITPQPFVTISVLKRLEYIYFLVFSPQYL